MTYTERLRTCWAKIPFLSKFCPSGDRSEDITGAGLGFCRWGGDSAGQVWLQVSEKRVVNQTIGHSRFLRGWWFLDHLNGVDNWRICNQSLSGKHTDDGEKPAYCLVMFPLSGFNCWARLNWNNHVTSRLHVSHDIMFQRRSMLTWIPRALFKNTLTLFGPYPTFFFYFILTNSRRFYSTRDLRFWNYSGFF